MKDTSSKQAKQGTQLGEIYGDIHMVSRIFYLFISLVLIGLVAGIFVVLTVNNFLIAMILAIGIIPVLLSAYLTWQKQLEAAAIFLGAFLLVTNTIISTNGLGIHSINNFAFPVILIIASLVTSKRTMFLLTALTVLCIGWLVFGELQGFYTPKVLVHSLPGDFFSASLIVVLTAVMVHQLTGALFRSFSQVQKEIVERKSIGEDLRQREAILEAVTFAAEQFLKMPAWRSNIDLVLERLGKTLHVTHAYLFEDHVSAEGDLLTSMRYEWTAPGYKSDLGGPYFQNSKVDQKGFEEQAAALKRGDVRVGNTSTFSAIEKVDMDSLGVKALLEVPVFVNGKEWGAIGFDDFEQERIWSNAETEALKIAAGVLGAAVQREIADSAVQESERIYRQAIEAAGAIPYYRDYINHRYAFMGSGIVDITGYTAEEITPQIWSQLQLEGFPRGSMAHLTYEEADRLTEAGILHHWECDYRMVNRQGQERWVADSCIQVLDEKNVRIGVVGILEDVTDRKKSEANLRKRESILEAITFAAEQFLKTSNWRTNIDVALQRLGGSLGATHTYLFEHHLDETGAEVSSLRYEWTAPGFKSDLENPLFQNSHPLREGVDSTDEMLRMGEAFIGNSSTFPEIEKERLAELGVKAMVEIPLFVNDEWWGTIGVDDMVNERDWSSAEVDALKVAAGILSAAIQREMAESAVRESERIYRQAIEAAGAVPYRLDYEENRYTFMGDGIKQILGYKPDEVTTDLMRSIVIETIPLGENTGMYLNEAVQRSRSGAMKIWKADMRVLDRNGQDRWLSDSAVELFGDDELSYGSVGILQDITERKNTEANLRKRESILEAVTFAAEQFLKTSNWRDTIDVVLHRLGEEFNASHAYLFERYRAEDGVLRSSMVNEWTAPGCVTDLENPEFQNMPPHPMGFERMYQILDAGEPLIASPSRMNDEERAYLASIGIKSLLEMRISVNGGQWGTIGFDDIFREREWTSMEVDVIKVAANVLGAAIQRKLDEDALKRELSERQRAEQKYRDIFNNSIDGVFQSTEDGHFLSVNPAMARIYGYDSPQDMLNSINNIGMQIYVNPEQRNEVRKRLSSGERLIGYETLDYRNDGSVFWASMSVQAIFDETGNVLYYEGTVEDISSRKKSEEERESLIQELAKKNAEAETLRETTSIVTSTLDVTESVEQILEQLKRVVPYDTASVWLYEGKRVQLVGSNGLSDSFSDDMWYISQDTEPDYQFISQDAPFILLDDVQQEYPQFREPPSDYIHGWLSVPLKARGKLIGFISLDSRERGRFTELDAHLALHFANQAAVALENARLFSDLQKELEERKKLIEELAKKNAELEQFTYTVSHDLKSPLVTINGFLGYLEQDALSGNIERLKKDTQRIQEAVYKMQRLLNELLELSRIGRMMNVPEMISFDDLINETMEIVHGRLKERGVVVQVQPHLPKVYGDRPRLVEVMQNLIDNAAKYMGYQENPRIVIGQRGTDGEQPIFFVSDNGMGIAPEHHDRVFGLFNKLDARSEGTGVGLALVKRIIEVHGGRIWLESEPNMGATFLFTLPTKPKPDYSPGASPDSVI